MLPYLQIEGRRIVADGIPVKLTGCNLGNFMLVEAYMLGLPGTEFQMRAAMRSQLGEEKFRAFWDTFMDVSFAEADAKFLSEMGFTLVQLPFNYRHFLADGTTSGFDQQGFEYVDRVIALCKAHGMRVLLSLHAAPGCAARDWNAESSSGETLLWEHEAFTQQSAAIWKSIATRYRDEPVVMGYELINEPVTDNLPALNHFHHECLAAVRSVDTRHIVVINGNKWGREMRGYDDSLLVDAQVMFSFHLYTVIQLPYKHLQSYPGEINGKPFGKAEALAAINDFLDPRIERPALVGEFGLVTGQIEFAAGGGMVSPNNFHAELNRDLIAEYNRREFPWTFWAYKDLGMISLVLPKADTPWRAFLARPEVVALEKSYNACSTLLSSKLAETLPQLKKDDVDLFTYQAKHHYDTMVLPYVIDLLKQYSPAELADMARSFAFENCIVEERKLAVYREGTK